MRLGGELSSCLLRDSLVRAPGFRESALSRARRVFNKGVYESGSKGHSAITGLPGEKASAPGTEASPTSQRSAPDGRFPCSLFSLRAFPAPSARRSSATSAGQRSLESVRRACHNLRATLTHMIAVTQRVICATPSALPSLRNAIRPQSRRPVSTSRPARTSTAPSRQASRRARTLCSQGSAARAARATSTAASTR